MPSFKKTPTELPLLLKNIDIVTMVKLHLRKKTEEDNATLRTALVVKQMKLEYVIHLYVKVRFQQTKYF